MTRHAEGEATPEFSRPVSIARLGKDGASFEIAAAEAERLALARRLGLVRLDALSAAIRMSRRRRDEILLEGEIAAEIVQDCVVTLEPFPSRLAEAFALSYRRGTAATAVDVEEDDSEPLVGDTIDIGEAVAQQLSLMIDPFPRAPGAVLPEPAAEGDDGDAAHPFAGLDRLIKR